MNILCIIPARSGSKSVPNKNIRLYKKKPLLAHAIDVAKQRKYRMRIVVSTDRQEYANIAIQYGAEAPFLRPLEISGDKSTSYDCVAHCVQYLEHNGYAPDIVVLLQPTSPTRTVEDLDTCLDIFLSPPSPSSLLPCPPGALPVLPLGTLSLCHPRTLRPSHPGAPRSIMAAQCTQILLFLRPSRRTVWRWPSRVLSALLVAASPLALREPRAASCRRAVHHTLRTSRHRKEGLCRHSRYSLHS